MDDARLPRQHFGDFRRGMADCDLDKVVAKAAAQQRGRNYGYHHHLQYG